MLAPVAPPFTGTDPLDLTPDQIRAARACGCLLTPATEAQVQRLTMQHRIFRIDGEPFLATRGGGLNESHGTLAALIEKHAPERDAGAEAAATRATAPTPAQDTTGGTDAPALTLGAPAPVQSEAAPPERKGRRAAAAKPRKPRTPPPEAAPASPEAASIAGTPAEPSEAADMLAGVEASRPAGRGARVVGRRRAGEPATPRWAVAGKLRRGRLK